MHRDLARYLTLLAVVRVLMLACTPQPVLSSTTWTDTVHHGSVQGLQPPDRRLLRDAGPSPWRLGPPGSRPVPVASRTARPRGVGPDL